MKAEIITGDLLDCDVEAIVNAWNRNIIPWWLLLPHGVSGAIKKRGGTKPFNEIGRKPIPLGDAVLTGAGKLLFKHIIHVAAINGWWRQRALDSTQRSERDENCERTEHHFCGVPTLGAGAGSFNPDQSLQLICNELENIETSSRVVIVRYGKK